MRLGQMIRSVVWALPKAGRTIFSCLHHTSTWRIV